MALGTRGHGPGHRRGELVAKAGLWHSPSAVLVKG